MEKLDYTIEVYKLDKRTKRGRKFVESVDLVKTLDEVKEFIKVQYPSDKKFVVTIHETFVMRKNLMSGELYKERYNTPSYCSPSCASYWSMW